jgi:hypothetical protein
MLKESTAAEENSCACRFLGTFANAARYAVMLATKYNAQIKLLHVFNSPVVDMIPLTDVASIQIDFDMNTTCFTIPPGKGL